MQRPTFFTLVRLSSKDYLNPFFIFISIIPLIVTLVILFTMFGSMMESTWIWLDSLNTATSGGITVEGQPVSSGVEEFWLVKLLAEYTFSKWLVMAFFYLSGAYFIIILSVVIAIMIIGLLTPMIVKKVHELHYPHVELKSFGTIIGFMMKLFKTLFVMMFLFILFIPLYFIPLVNIVALNFPFYYFYHVMMLDDVGSNIVDRKEFFTIVDENKPSIYGHTLILFTLAMLPLAGLLLQGFFVIYLSHFFFLEVQKYRD
jgi:hypothetical protein